MSDDRLIEALLRQDLPSFVAKAFCTIDPRTPYRENWHIRHIGHKLQQVHRGECRRLITNIPPRHLKSICVTVAFSARVMGHDPGSKIICVSYSRDLARKHATDFRIIVEAPWYRELFPAFHIKPGGKRDTEIETTAQGNRLAGSVGGSVLGRGADLIIVDDPIKGQDAFSEAERRRVKEFYDNVLYLLDLIRERLEVPNLRRCIIETHRRWRANATLIEDTDIGRAIGQELRRSGALRPLMHRPRYDKQARMLAQSPTFERGDVLLPREAEWLGAYVGELMAFPNARHDDQVDSTAQALEWLAARLAPGVPPRRPNPTRPQGSPLQGGRRPAPQRPLGLLRR